MIETTLFKEAKVTDYEDTQTAIKLEVRLQELTPPNKEKEPEGRGPRGWV